MKRAVNSLGWLLLLFLFLPSLHAQQTLPSPSRSQTEKAGEKLYLQRCSLCHSGTAPAYETYGPLLDSQLVASRGEDRVRDVIMHGSPKMPGWQYALKPAQVDSVIAYLKTLKKQ